MADYEQWIRQAAAQHGVDPGLFRRMLMQESSLNPKSVSNKGARGIGQFMPGTAKRLGVNPDDPRSSIFGAARLLAEGRGLFGNDPKDQLSYYNSGLPWSKGRLIPETVTHVNRILGGQGPSVDPAARPSGPGFSSTAAGFTVPPGLLQGLRQPNLNIAPPEPAPTYPNLTPLLDKREQYQRDLQRATHPYQLEQAKAAAEGAGTEAYLQNLPAVDPNDPRYTFSPYTPSPQPERQVAPIPDVPALRTDPMSTLFGLLGGLISPHAAGTLNAAPLQAANQVREHDYLQDLQRQQLFQGQADTSFSDQVRARDEAERTALFNRAGQSQADDLRAQAVEADALRRAQLRGQTAQTGSLLQAIPGLEQVEQNRIGAEQNIGNAELEIKLLQDQYEDQSKSWKAQNDPYMRLQMEMLKQGSQNQRAEAINRIKVWLAGVTGRGAGGSGGPGKDLTTYQKYNLGRQFINMGASPQEAEEMVNAGGGLPIHLSGNLATAPGLKREFDLGKLQTQYNTAINRNPEVVRATDRYKASLSYRKAMEDAFQAAQRTGFADAIKKAADARDKANEDLSIQEGLLNEAYQHASAQTRRPSTPGTGVNTGTGSGQQKKRQGFGITPGKSGGRTMSSGLLGGG